MTFTAVCSGLDVVIGNLGTTATLTLYVDGISQGTFASTSGDPKKILRLVSGISYGTHTFKLGNHTLDSLSLFDFKVYAPKTPTLPSFAKLINKYYIMADYVANTTYSSETIATGVCRKICMREFVYAGTWTGVGSVDATQLSGFDMNTVTSGSKVTMYFWGRGCELRFRTASGASSNITVSVDGNTNLSTAGWDTALYGASGSSWTPSSGLLSQASSGAGWGSILRLYGTTTVIPLGWHKVEVTNNTSVLMTISGMDVITPVYYPKNMNESDGTIQNTLPVGSCSLGDMRKIVDPNAKPQKIVATAVGITSNPSTSSTSMVPCPDMSVTVNSPGAWFDISYSIPVAADAAGRQLFMRVFVNGVAFGPYMMISGPVAGYTSFIGDSIPCYLAKGTHKIDITWGVNTGTLTGIATYRKLVVEER